MKMKLLCSTLALCLAGIHSQALSAASLNPTRYNMPNGDGNANQGTYNYWDATYSGSGAKTTDSAPLTGGLGVLTDGYASPDAWYKVSNLQGTGPYVGWEWRNNGDPTIAFTFATPVRVNTVSLAVDASEIGGVYAPVALTIDGATYTPTVTAISSTSEWLTVSGLSLVGATLTITPDHDPSDGSNWTFVSEAQFTGGAVPEPTTWAMMIVGFSGVVYARYRASRKRVAVAL